ncbi:hypothetical protein [Bacillus manliponensis]|nr:hypothetical protein [Bacillus manliponensis]
MLKMKKLAGIALATTLGLSGLGTFLATDTQAAVQNQESKQSIAKTATSYHDMYLKVGKSERMEPQGSGYKYVLFSDDEIYVNSKTGKVTAHGPGLAEGRVLDKSGNVVAIYYIVAEY